VWEVAQPAQVQQELVLAQPVLQVVQSAQELVSAPSVPEPALVRQVAEPVSVPQVLELEPASEPQVQELEWEQQVEEPVLPLGVAAS